MSHVVTRFRKGRRVIAVYHDESPSNPRENEFHYAKLVLYHRSYNLGDAHSIHRDHFEDLETLAEMLREEYSPRLLVPVSFHDYGYVSLEAKPHSGGPFDRSVCGFAVVTHDVVEEIGNLDVTDAQLIDEINAELTEYSAYINGEVYEYCFDTDLEKEWVGGFIGTDYVANGLIESAFGTTEGVVEQNASGSWPKAPEPPRDPSVVALLRGAWLGVKDGVESPDELTVGMTWENETQNELYDAGVNIGQSVVALKRAVKSIATAAYQRATAAYERARS